ncbi:MAG: N-acetylmuramic acid 6-phosphate etherase, partial [Chloroflexi bacterium]|nr:N-acetylmuramic acid 6-phosphate etherase [Chloroflexota bacterium]
GILDAAECVPTFDTPPELVQGVIAGGAPAMTRPVEGAEDDTRTGRAVIVEHGISAGDVVTGLSASGRAPYVLACLDAAREVGAFTIGVCCTEHSAMEGRCDVLIAPVVGPEVLTGSTRLKAGTAQKLVLNMLSTASMVRLGKCYGNLMVDVQATNFKLRDRAARIVATVTRQPYALAWAALDRAGFRTKVAIVMIAKNIEADEAEQRLAVARGQLRRVLESKT